MGPCAKQRVRALLIAKSGGEFYGENTCESPQIACPRGDMPTGVGYELCKSVCRQTGHAEENAIKAAGDDAYGATLILSGHNYACSNCMAIAEKYGVKVIVWSDK